MANAEVFLAGEMDIVNIAEENVPHTGNVPAVESGALLLADYGAFALSFRKTAGISNK